MLQSLSGWDCDGQILIGNSIIGFIGFIAAKDNINWLTSRNKPRKMVYNCRGRRHGCFHGGYQFEQFRFSVVGEHSRKLRRTRTGFSRPASSKRPELWGLLRRQYVYDRL